MAIQNTPSSLANRDSVSGLGSGQAMADCPSHALNVDTLFDLILILFYRQVHMNYHLELLKVQVLTKMDTKLYCFFFFIGYWLLEAGNYQLYVLVQKC